MPSLDRNRWVRLWADLGAKGDAIAAFDQLCKAYTNPPRAYHNASHIVDCLSEFDSAKHIAQNAHAVEIALWYHDAVYDSKAKDNEERSAEMAVDVLKTAGLSESLASTIHKLILATKHAAPPTEPDAALITDVDLSILGKPWPAFQKYESEIREEYGWVSDVDFAAGRSKILNSFLERNSIYATEFFRQKFETSARENLRHSVDLLRKKTS